jgi:hypothetical protein
MADENAPHQKTVLGRSKIFTPEVIDDIHMKAELGRYRMRGFSMFKKIPHWDELIFLPGTLTRCKITFEGSLGYFGVGLGDPPQFQKFVCGKTLYNYDSLEPSERKLVL